MTTIQIQLPDQLAQEAIQAGLLSPTAIESLLQERLKAKRSDELFAALDRMSAMGEPPYMAPKEVAVEIRAMRTERVAQLTR